MKIGIIIQARTDSNRFPKKVLKIINQQPVLWHVINQCKEMNLDIIVATTKRKKDDPIVKIAKKMKVKFFRGSKNDVLDRYYQTAKKFNLNGIIRITADCPFIDPKESMKVVKSLKLKKTDYISLDEKTYPDGLDTEGFTFESLELAWKNARLKSEREHVTPYIKNKLKNIKKKNIKYKKNLSHIRLTIDEKEDYELAKTIFEKFNSKHIICLKDITKMLENNPKLIEINSKYNRNEGYEKSLNEDKKLEVNNRFSNI
jgi:spore coat polysaccharide biosynthesis protein SpsF